MADYMPGRAAQTASSIPVANYHTPPICQLNFWFNTAAGGPDGFALIFGRGSDRPLRVRLDC
jgi:hypothetical protein